MLKRFRAFAIIIGLISLVTLVFITRTTKSTDLQTLINDAPCGSTISLPPDSIFFGNYRLPNKGCTATNRIRITTQGFSVPSGQRVSPADFPLMAKIRTPGNGLPLFEADEGAGGYELIGLDLGVNYGSDPNRKYHSSILIIFANGNDSNRSYGAHLAHDITIDRCHIAGKFNDSRFAIAFNGIDLSLINSYLDEFANGSVNGQSLGDSCGVWMGTGPGPYTIENNFISAAMWNIFMGGADPDSPNFGTVALGSTAAGLTLTEINGIAPKVGDLLSIKVTENNPTVAPWLPQAPLGLYQRLYRHTQSTSATGRPPALFYVTKPGLSGTSEPDFFNAHENRPLIDGTAEWRQEVTGYQIGRVTGVTGATFTLEPAWPQGLVLPPVAGTIVKWNGNVPSGISIRRNHFFRPAAWAAANAANKGMFQFKNARRVVIEGNYFESEAQYPGWINLTAGNQGGTAPWSTVADITIKDNWGRHLGALFNFSLQDSFGKTATPGKNIVITNNLLTEIGGSAEGDLGTFLQASRTEGVQVIHNTVINNHQLLFAYGGAQPGFIMRDNIVTFNRSMTCTEPAGPMFEVCFPGAVVTNNAIVNVPFERREEFPPGNFFPATHLDVGFTSFGGATLQAWALSAQSPYKGRASDGKDPGANVDLIEAALAGTLPQPSPTPTPTPSPSPAVSPSPSPTPSITTRFLNGYVKVNGIYFNGIAVVTSSAGQSFTTSPGGYFELENVPLRSILSASAPGYMFPSLTVDMSPYFILDGQASPSPTPTPSPVPSPSPSPVSTPTPSPTPSPSPTPGPTPRCLKFHPKTNQCQKWSI